LPQARPSPARKIPVAIGARFYNDYGDTLQLYWDAPGPNPRGSFLQGTLLPGGTLGMKSYVGHAFHAELAVRPIAPSWTRPIVLQESYRTKYLNICEPPLPGRHPHAHIYARVVSPSRDDLSPPVCLQGERVWGAVLNGKPKQFYNVSRLALTLYRRRYNCPKYPDRLAAETCGEM
jgi:hypothetical protein